MKKDSLPGYEAKGFIKKSEKNKKAEGILTAADNRQRNAAYTENTPEKYIPAAAGGAGSVVVFSILLVIVAALSAAMYYRNHGGYGENLAASYSQNATGALLQNMPGSDTDVDPVQQRLVISEILGSVSYDMSEDPLFIEAGGLLIKKSRDDIRAYDSLGAELWSINLKTAVPLIKSAGRWLAVADTASAQIDVINAADGDIRWNAQTEGNITGLYISDKGWVCVTHEAENSRSAVTLFDSRGVRVFTSYFARRYVIAAYITPDGKRLLYNILNTGGAKAYTEFEFTDIVGNVGGIRTSPLRNVFPAVHFLSGDTAAAFGEKMVFCFNYENGMMWKAELDTGKFLYAGVSGRKYPVVVLGEVPDFKSNAGLMGEAGMAGVSEVTGIAGDAGNTGEITGIVYDNISEVRIIGKDGGIYASYFVGGENPEVSFFGDNIGVCTVKGVYFHNNNGELLGTYITGRGAEPLKVVMLSEGEAAVIRSDNRIVFLRYN
ncbi:MAG: DUF5711 family protein [Eubacteriales bacterium]|nr:DUF5711 family protein [Eubacteriales bacterium]